MNCSGRRETRTARKASQQLDTCACILECFLFGFLFCFFVFCFKPQRTQLIHELYPDQMKLTSAGEASVDRPENQERSAEPAAGNGAQKCGHLPLGLF